MTDQSVLELAQEFATHRKATGYSPPRSARLTKGDGTGTLVVTPALRAREVWTWTDNLAGGRDSKPVVLHPNINIPFENNVAYENLEVMIGKQPGDDTEYVLWVSGHSGLQNMPITPLEQKVNATGYPPAANISTFRAYPTSPVSSSINIDGPLAYINPSTGALGLIPVTNTFDIISPSDVRPGSANQHALGLLYFDPVTGSFGMITTTPATASSGSVPSRAEFVTSDFTSLLPAYYMPVATIYLYNGQTTVVESATASDSDFLRQYEPRIIFANPVPQMCPVRVHTVVGAVTVTISDYTIVVNKSVGAATTVNLPSGIAGLTFWIKDGRGDANTNNITVTPAAGNIDGVGSKTINTAYGRMLVQYNGTEWNVLVSQ